MAKRTLKKRLARVDRELGGSPYTPEKFVKKLKKANKRFGGTVFG